MIIIRLSGGLGNQMFEYAFGLAQAAKNRTELVIDASAYGTRDRLRTFGLDGFNISARRAMSSDFKKIGVPDWSRTDFISRGMRKLFREIDEKRPLSQRRSFFEPRFSYTEETEHLGSDVLFIGNWQSERYFTSVRDELRREYTLVSWGKLANAFKKQIEEHVGGTPVSVHVRRGDYATNEETSRKHGVLPISYYERAAALISDRVQDPVFYVFSDDTEWCRRNLGFLKPMVIVSDPDLTPNEEIILMSLADRHIIANSTFSWWGAWLDARPGAIVIAPAQWFKNGIETKDLLPSDWISI